MSEQIQGRRKLTRKEIITKGVISGLELAVYITAPIVLGYYIGLGLGGLGMVACMLAGAVLGLVLAVRRALKMTV